MAVEDILSDEEIAAIKEIGMSGSSSSSGGIGVLGLLGVVFVTLKLCSVIDWSWWWVTAPFWGGVALLLAVFFGALAYYAATDR